MDVNAGIVRNFLAKSFPDLFMRRQLKQALGNVVPDENNFSSAEELRTFLLSYDVISFDYFDTLASRVISLNALQDLTSRQGAQLLAAHHANFPEGHLRDSRCWFQERLKSHYKSLEPRRYRNEVDLRDLFERALRPYLSNSTERAGMADDLVRYEVSVEKAVLQTHQDFRELLSFLKENKKTTILTSDMYLSREDMIEVISAQGLLPLFDHIFVSATTGVTKNSGLLFTEIDRELGFSRERRIHIGDNFTNDFLRPRERGWEAVHYFQPEREAHRRKLEMEYKLGKSTERTRFDRFLSYYLGNEHPDAQRLLAASFAVFVRRIIERAERHNIDTIYFLTRDGTIFGEIAKNFLNSAQGRGLLNNVKLDTLALNRRAGVLLDYPSIHDRGWLDHYVRYLNQTPISLRTIMQTFGVHVNELGGLSKGEQRLVESCLTTPQTRDLDMEGLDAHPNIRDALDLALKHKRHQILNYLEQKGVLDPARSLMFVDVGYSGTILKSISQLFGDTELRRHAPIENFGARIELCMFASNRFLPDNHGQMHPKCRVAPGMVINLNSKESRALSVNFAWLEPFCLDGSLGSLQGYREGRDGIMEPIFGEGSSDCEDEAFRAALLKAAQDYFDLSVQSNIPIEQLDAMIIKKMIKSFSYPSSETVALVRKLLHDTGNTETNFESVVQKVRWHHPRRDLSRILSEDKWAQGSLQNSGMNCLIPIFNFLISRALQ